MNIFDKVLASAYYVFEGELNSHIIRSFITLMRKNGYQFKRDELQMNELRKYMDFQNHKYVLKDNYTISDISDFINFDMVAVFHNLKKSRDRYYSDLGRNFVPKVKRK